MNLKQQLIIGLVLLIGGFLGGRYSNVKPETTTKIETAKDQETVKQVKKVITTTKDKDGNEKTVTVIDSTTDSKSKEVSRSDTTTKSLPKYHVAVLYGLDKNENHINGLAVETSFGGPFTIGAFGLNNNNYGLSLGVSF